MDQFQLWRAWAFLLSLLLPVSIRAEMGAQSKLLGGHKLGSHRGQASDGNSHPLTGPRLDVVAESERFCSLLANMSVLAPQKNLILKPACTYTNSEVICMHFHTADFPRQKTFFNCHKLGVLIPPAATSGIAVLSFDGGLSLSSKFTHSILLNLLIFVFLPS